jgi:predicted CopG family antitoxin
MFGGNKIKLDPDIYERLKKVSELSGYASVDEFVLHVLERELAKFDDADSEEEIKKRLEGHGYMS